MKWLKNGRRNIIKAALRYRRTSFIMFYREPTGGSVTMAACIQLLTFEVSRSPENSGVGEVFRYASMLKVTLGINAAHR